MYNYKLNTVDPPEYTEDSRTLVLDIYRVSVACLY